MYDVNTPEGTSGDGYDRRLQWGGILETTSDESLGGHCVAESVPFWTISLTARGVNSPSRSCTSSILWRRYGRDLRIGVTVKSQAQRLC